MNGGNEKNQKGQIVVYIKLERSVEVEGPEVLLSDVASVECTDEEVKESARRLCVYRFEVEGQKRTVISILRIIQLLERKLAYSCKQPILVQNVGEKDVFVQWVNQNEKKRPANPWKIALVSLVTFCGTAFTLVAYHNDIEIHKIFEGVAKVIMPQDFQLGLLVLEIAYSVGLAVGIIVFFNHVGKWKLSNDPTPIEVALRKYEVDVDTTLIESADREGEEVDAR
ncbi:MAG: stage V sporulation protein AA [Lachnospiraceae bacterium]|nr:stage V sporulation protein AA [Lachnospiraceae bacterium]